MWITYKPEGGEEKTWWWKAEKVSDREAEMIEMRSGYDWIDWEARALKGNRRARRALLWTLLRRDHHTLRYEDVTFTDEEFELALDAQEVGERIQAGEAKRERGEFTEDDAAVLAYFKRILPDAKPAPGKAHGQPDDSSTKQPSSTTSTRNRPK